jgi:hypothetical protein
LTKQELNELVVRKGSKEKLVIKNFPVYKRKVDIIITKIMLRDVNK